MSRRDAVRAGAVGWAAVGVALAVPSIRTVNADARLLVGAASILGPLSALGASLLVGRHRDRWAGVFLTASVITPTYFAWPLNVPALVMGAVLLVGPGALSPPRSGLRHPAAPHP